LPEFHFEELVKLRAEAEKALTNGQREKHFDINEAVLPNLECLLYKIPNSLVLLDRDIKQLWREQVAIDDRMKEVRTVNNMEVKAIYKDKLDSLAGKNYQYSSVENRAEMKMVCHTCYSFYKKLQFKIFNPKGHLRHESLHKISDPQYQINQEKVVEFEKIKKIISLGLVY